MNITVIGGGYVGTTVAALFALADHEVVTLDIDASKVEVINSGGAPFFENGLDKAITAGIEKNRLTATTDYEQALRNADFVFSCVATPDHTDGSSDLQYVFKAAKTAAKYLKPTAVYIQKSTVPVGTGGKVIELLPKGQAYVSNPEFLREGTAIYDTLLFDRVVAGGDDQEAIRKVIDLYKTIEERAPEIAKIIGLDIAHELKKHNGEYIITQLESAELIKVTANAFLALKISFANSIAKLCDKVHADVVEVMDAVGVDKRIGRAFLNAGRGYGGGCFPKDVSGLISSSAEYGIDMPIMTAATEVNDSMPGYIASRVEEMLGGSLADKKVAVLGLSFKAGTSDTRRSPGVKIANLLSKFGASVSVYDPYANGEAKRDLNKAIEVCDSVLGAASKADALIIATAWSEFKEMDYDRIKKVMHGDLIYDADNCISQNSLEGTGLRFDAVGRIK